MSFHGETLHWRKKSIFILSSRQLKRYMFLFNFIIFSIDNFFYFPQLFISRIYYEKYNCIIFISMSLKNTVKNIVINNAFLKREERDETVFLTTFLNVIIHQYVLLHYKELYFSITTFMISIIDF